MFKGDEIRIWVGVGLVGSLLLGTALMPFRSITTASNLAFVFLAFTFIVAQRGGRTAALVTALTSAMSLNFLLTEPYFQSMIDTLDDLVAFPSLAGCGLIAAAFGQRRDVGRQWPVARETN